MQPDLIAQIVAVGGESIDADCERHALETSTRTFKRNRLFIGHEFTS